MDMVLWRLNIKAICFFIAGFMVVQLAGLNYLFAKENKAEPETIEIVVKEVSFATGSKIFLGDISVIHASDFLKEALQKISLGSSPEPGRIKAFDKKKIISALHGQRYLPENINIISPQRIYIKRLSQTISRQDIQKFVDSQLAIIFKNKEYQLTAFNVRGLELYPKGNIRFRFDSNKIINKSGKLSSYLDVFINGRKEDRLSVSGIVALYENVLYAKKSLKRGETLTRKDVCRKKKNIYGLKQNYLKTFEDIKEKVLKTSVRKGDYLNADMLTALPLVKKGDIITLVVKNKNLLIVTSGISKENGFENELIKVENLNSGKLVRGIIKGKSKVEVVY